MSYETDINSNIIHMPAPAVNKFFMQLDGAYPSQSLLIDLDNNQTVELKGVKYTFKNTKLGVHIYNLYDVVAIALAAGYSYKDIDAALNSAAYNSIITNKKEHKAFQDAYIKLQNATPKGQPLSLSINLQTTPAVKQLTSVIRKRYPNANTIVEARLKTNGKGYDYVVRCIGPDGTFYEYPVSADLINEDGSINEAVANTWALSLNLDHLTDPNTKNTVNQNDADLAAAFLERLDAGGVTYANTGADLSAADRAAITAALPDTGDLTAWNKTKGISVFDRLVQNLQQTNPELLERMDLPRLKGAADALSDAQQSITERNISNQQAQLLQQIQKDPALYEAVTKQRRVDNAAGTVAGQRAANVQQATAEADKSYNAQSDEVYQSLFGGENGNVAQATYADHLGNKTAALDTVIQGKLDDAMVKEGANATAVQELGTMLEAIAAATGVDVSRYANEIAERQAAAGGKATGLSDKVLGDLETAIASGTADTNYLTNLFAEGSAYNNTGLDMSAALDVIKKAFNNAVPKSGYKVVTPGEYKKAEQFDNAQYDAIIKALEDPELSNYLFGNDSIDALTKMQSIEGFMGTHELGMLNLEGEGGLIDTYGQYNTESTQQANKVFNQAQRAYIAAITAGDAKTADQLARLANTTGTAKGNLYAASALANQFKQQSGLSNTGRQMATDFLNQQSFNEANKNQAIINAANAQLKYLGDGTQRSGGATLYDAYLQHGRNTANAFDAYGKLGTSLMNLNQDMSGLSVQNNIDNWNRLVDLASKYTGANAAGAAANNKTRGSIETLRAQAEAKLRQAIANGAVNNYTGKLKY